jgi:hypothetical protein
MKKRGPVARKEKNASSKILSLRLSFYFAPLR